MVLRWTEIHEAELAGVDDSNIVVINHGKTDPQDDYMLYCTVCQYTWKPGNRRITKM